MIEKNPGTFTVSDITAENRIPPILRLRTHVQQLSDEIDLDPDTYESLRKFANIYFRLEKLKLDFGARRARLMGYPVDYGQDQSEKIKYHYVLREASDEMIKTLARSAFDVYDSSLSGSEQTKIAVFRVREFIHQLNR